MISVEIAQDDSDLLVVTENGYGKRTRVSDYPRKGRGGMGVKTIQLTEAKRQARRRARRSRRLPGDADLDGRHSDPMPVEEIKRLGRSTQGVIVVRLRGTSASPRSRRSSNRTRTDPDGDEDPSRSTPATHGARGRQTRVPHVRNSSGQLSRGRCPSQTQVRRV